MRPQPPRVRVPSRPCSSTGAVLETNERGIGNARAPTASTPVTRYIDQPVGASPYPISARAYMIQPMMTSLRSRAQLLPPLSRSHERPKIATALQPSLVARKKPTVSRLQPKRFRVYKMTTPCQPQTVISAPKSASVSIGRIVHGPWKSTAKTDKELS